jgi:hypothetical protein
MTPGTPRPTAFEFSALAACDAPAAAGPTKTGLFGAEICYGQAFACALVIFWGVGDLAEQSETLVFFQFAAAFAIAPVAEPVG